MKQISILGSTGSIGQNTLEIIDEYRDKFTVIGLAAGTNAQKLAEQIRSFRPKIASLATEDAAQTCREILGPTDTKIVCGAEGIVEVATHPDANLLVSAVVGAAGLIPTWRAIEAGKDIALANKETLVTAGALFMNKVRQSGVNLIPVDSEHSAIFQSLVGQYRPALKKIILTASGGPFRGMTRDQLAEVTPERALRHPNWDMGPKITIDSATLMNKGLEVIEARWLFDLAVEQIDVVVHPESIIHSMVEFIDGQIVAQLGFPHMKGPIGYALTYPERLGNMNQSLDFTQVGSLHFFKADTEAFPCLALAFEALKGRASMPAALNAANEVAVGAFLSGKIGFTDIPRVLEAVLGTMSHHELSELEEVVAIDSEGRRKAEQFISSIRR